MLKHLLNIISFPKKQKNTEKSYEFHSPLNSNPLSFIYALICLIIFFSLISCGRKMDPTLDEYLPPEPVEKINLILTSDKILLSWNYPNKAKNKIKSFLIEKEYKGERKILGYFSNETNSLEDKEFIFDETYKYRIFAISLKGIYSKPKEIIFTPILLPEIKDFKYQITTEGVIISWRADKSLSYNIYRINQKDEKIKIGSTDKNFFKDELTFSTINTFSFNGKLIYLITAYVSSEDKYIESKGTEISIPLDSFVPSKPHQVFWSITEEGIHISWKEVPEKWCKGYKIYRKISPVEEFKFIGDTSIPLFVDTEYSSNKLKSPVYYRVTAEGPSRESIAEEIMVIINF
jgi:hypothetical protein